MGTGFERLRGALQYQIVNTLGFAGLRPVQEQTIHAVLDGDDCVVLAPTAGGKTEAAFFPLLSRMDAEDWAPVSVLYLSPIRALLNNQEERVARYAALIGRRVFKWHGDVGPGPRKQFLAAPADILLTTPESLEAMLISPRVPTRALFHGLRAVVIDEVHAFADDDRGAHLAAVLERLSRYSGRELQRIGLSATVGNPAEILAWLRGGSARPGRVVDPGGTKAQPELRIDFVGSMANAAIAIDAMHRGRKRLVFVDSRRGAEELGSRLVERGVTTFVTHGSLSVTARRDAELAFEQGQDCVIVATSALELGIDVGDLDHVVQIDAPGTVASFLQRMGRTGRRPGTRPNCTFLATREDRLLQAMALVRLQQRGFVEPVRPSRRASHIFAHQVLSLAIQTGGLPPQDVWGWLQGAAPFEGLEPSERQSVLDHMLHRGILADHDGKLWLGTDGERRYGRANFRELYAVFDAPRMITVRHAGQEIGTVDAAFLASLTEEGGLPSFILAGRAWQVLDIDWSKGLCGVRPADAGRAPRWAGGSRHLGYELCQTMREILLADDEDPIWTARARKCLAEQRLAHAFLRDSDDGFVHDKDEHVTWHDFAGGAANVLMARLFERELGGSVVARNTSIGFVGQAGKSMVAIRKAMEALREGGRPTWRDALRFAPDASRSRVTKFQPCLPDALARDLIVRTTVDLPNARRVLGLPGEVVEEREEHAYCRPQRPIAWVDTSEGLAAAVARLSRVPFVALDVETTLEDQELCLVQLGTPSESILVDPLAVAELEPLARLLADARIVKVIHYAQFERSVLGRRGMVIENVYDTYEVSKQRRGSSAAGHSLLAVARRELDLVVDEKPQLSDWKVRPLSQAQREYAALDVELLVGLFGVFEGEGRGA